MRAAIFIDGGYVLSQFKQYKINADYRRLADYLLQPLRQTVPLDLLRCYFYYCPPWMSADPTEDELRRMDAHDLFVEEVESFDRWQVRLGKLQKRRDGNKEYFEQKRVDVLLSVDMARHAAAGHIQHAILVAGDSDFIPAVIAAKESGVTLTLWCGASNTVHNDLVVLADEVHYLDWARFPQLSEKDKKESSLSDTARIDKRRESTKKKKDVVHKRPTMPPLPSSGHARDRDRGYQPRSGGEFMMSQPPETLPEEKKPNFTKKFTSRLKKMAGRPDTD